MPLGIFEPTADDPLFTNKRMERFIGPYTALYNITGQPAASVPTYWNNDGLPIDIQLAARYGDEGTIFRLAAQMESERPWAGRRPPVSA